MEPTSPENKFEVENIAEQTPFKETSFCAFFKKWCEVNDSIVPEIVSREEWLKKRKIGGLEKRDDGKKSLYVPEDLKLWEMVGVMEEIDRDTFSDQPEKQTKKAEELRAFGKTLENAGAYIAERTNGIADGREIAEALAEELYTYGHSLASGQKEEQMTEISKIPKTEMTEEEITEIDRFLAGDELYNRRKERAEWSGESDEEMRQKTLSQFFRVANKALALSASGELEVSETGLKPWQDDVSIHTAFLEKIEKSLKQKIETPKRELVSAMFRRGMELLQKNMPFDKLPAWVKVCYLHWQSGEKTLREALKIDELKTELEEIRKTGDIAKISQKETEISNKIQGVVSQFAYKKYADNPAEMVANQYLNCVGASTLGGALMKEVGLNYLVGDVPKHSILFLVTSDGKVEWRDMLRAYPNENLTDEMIDGRKKDGAPLTVNDIVRFSKEPTPEGLMFDVNGDKYTEKLPWVEEGQRQYVAVFEPEHGQKIQVLNNMGGVLYETGHYDEAIEAFRQAVSLNPKFAYPYDGLGKSLSKKTDRHEEALGAYLQAIKTNPKYEQAYYDLGYELFSLCRYEEAVEAYQEAREINPKFPYSFHNLGEALYHLGRYKEAVEAYQYTIYGESQDYASYYGLGRTLSVLGRDKEAIEAYKKYIKLADKTKYAYWIEMAELQIAILNDTKKNT